MYYIIGHIYDYFKSKAKGLFVLALIVMFLQTNKKVNAALRSFDTDLKYMQIQSYTSTLLLSLIL